MTGLSLIYNRIEPSPVPLGRGWGMRVCNFSALANIEFLGIKASNFSNYMVGPYCIGLELDVFQAH